MPGLHVFDRHVVTPEEQEAAKLLGTSRQKKEETGDRVRGIW
jgi:hypothetical protein